MIACIITRYKEYIDWIDFIEKFVDIFYIYNKGPDENLFKNLVLTPELSNKIKIIKLENIGRIDHTLTYHIVNNWDSLEETIINLPASVLMCRLKGSYLSAIRKRLHQLDRWNGFYSPRFRKVDNFNYSIDNYQAEGACNRNDNPFIKSEYPDFLTWKSAIIDDLPMKCVAMRGMFVVNRENIKFISKEIYERMLISLSVGDNIENGHFAERIWGHLFTRSKLNTVQG
jgi:hypothetical protein